MSLFVLVPKFIECLNIPLCFRLNLFILGFFLFLYNRDQHTPPLLVSWVTTRVSFLIESHYLRTYFLPFQTREEGSPIILSSLTSPKTRLHSFLLMSFLYVPPDLVSTVVHDGHFYRTPVDTYILVKDYPLVVSTDSPPPPISTVVLKVRRTSTRVIVFFL